MRTRLTGVVAALSLLLAGCGGAQAGSPATPTESTSPYPSRSSASKPGHSQAPRDLPEVIDPIDVTTWLQEPCSVLTNEQLAKLSISTEPEPKTSATGPTCEWGDVFDDGITIEGSFGTKSTSTIPGFFRNNELGKYSYFVPVTIRGYPGALFGIADDRDGGGCGIAIALRKKHMYAISLRLGEERPNYSDPCSVLKGIAQMAVKSMTQGSS